MRVAGLCRPVDLATTLSCDATAILSFFQSCGEEIGLDPPFLSLAHSAPEARQVRASRQRRERERWISMSGIGDTAATRSRTRRRTKSRRPCSKANTGSRRRRDRAVDRPRVARASGNLFGRRTGGPPRTAQKNDEPTARRRRGDEATARVVISPGPPPPRCCSWRSARSRSR